MRLLIAGIVVGVALFIASFFVRTCRIPYHVVDFGPNCLMPRTWAIGYAIVFWMILIGGIMAWRARNRERD
ncbi:MAG TPA: hypothetical protein VEC11_11120 [Allosphingosinicella sp.]|nr:hypothetical protein [Allosphingosinicella sp.]